MQRAADINADGLFRLIGELQEQARRLGRKAEKEKNYSAAIAALRELSRHVELLGAIATMPGARTELSYGLRLEIGGPGRGSEEYSVQPLTAEELAGRPALPAAPEPGAGPLESAVEKAMQATSEPIEAGPEPAPSRGGSVRVPRPVDGGHRTTPAERAQWRDWQEEAARDRFSGF
jgi:hypothetical protein